MGRKRTSNKKDVTLYVDKDLLKKLKEWEINMSLVFTKAAQNMINDLEKSEKNEEMSKMSEKNS